MHSQSSNRTCHKQVHNNLKNQILKSSWLLTTVNAKLEYLVNKLRFSKQIAHERRILSHLTDHQLRDIGLTRDQVDYEAGKGFFDTPSARYGDIEFLQTGSRNIYRKPSIHRMPQD